MTWSELARLISTMPDWMRGTEVEIYLDHNNRIAWNDSTPVAGVLTYYGEDNLADATNDGMNYACLYLND